MSNSEHPERLTRQIMIRLSPAQHEALEAAAHRERRTVSSLVRVILEDWLADNQ